MVHRVGENNTFLPSPIIMQSQLRRQAYFFLLTRGEISSRCVDVIWNTLNNPIRKTKFLESVVIYFWTIIIASMFQSDSPTFIEE